MGGRHAATTQGFKERSVVLAVAHPWASASSYLSSQSLADSRCNLHATSRSSHSRRSPSCRFILCRVALLYLVLLRRRCPGRSLPLAASSRRNSALLAAYFGPSSLSSSPRARTTLLTPTPIICRQVGVPTMHDDAFIFFGRCGALQDKQWRAFAPMSWSRWLV